MACQGSVRRFQTLRQSARCAGFVALVFSLTVAALLGADWARVDGAQTVRSEVLAKALSRSRAEAQDESAVAFARELDLLARRAYFNSLSFRQGGMALLVFGLLATAGCFGLAWRLSLQIPDPRGLSESDPARTDRLTVTAVLASGVALLAAAAALEARHGRLAAPASDRALRARLENPALGPGEANVCPCRRGTRPQEMEANWPFLRGPSSSGRAAAGQAPLAWNGETGQGVRWKVEPVRGGSSTPVVWGQRLFLTSGDVAARTVLAHDTETGKPLWRTDIPDGGAKAGEPLPEVGEDTGFAASTPACDEARVYAVFGTGDLAALDHDGRIVWQRYLGRPHNTYGHASSLVYCGEMLLVQWDQEEKSRLLALDKATGRTLWETPRAAGMSWSTPVVMPACDKPLLLVHASQQTWGVELATGKMLWQVDAVTGEVAPSPTWEGDVWLAANCYSRMVAFRLPPEGAPVKLWEWEDGNLPDVASPVVADGLIYLATDAGEVRCHSLEDGKEVWHREFADGYYASPVVAAGRLYVVDRAKGLFRVFAADREGRELASNPLGEGVSATPAFVRGRLYIRSHKHLWCVE